eukprot:TRINITY_DN214_c0_g1_i2.p1 TRINITY_DN214_c0_g1~~TRINITY_DN214_c0_g1_i2.p1  ORF type:complete len:162 (+),score=51.20 TRINITY_DN214_c0_g1_i2:55-486(+)
MESEFQLEPIKIVENTYRLEPKAGEKFSPLKVKEVLEEILDRRLKDKKYDPEECTNLTKELCTEIQNKVKELNFPRYKLVTQVVISEARGQAQMVASRCLWDTQQSSSSENASPSPGNDNFASYTFRNTSISVVAMVFGLYYE